MNTKWAPEQTIIGPPGLRSRQGQHGWERGAEKGRGSGHPSSWHEAGKWGTQGRRRECDHTGRGAKPTVGERERPVEVSWSQTMKGLE